LDGKAVIPTPLLCKGFAGGNDALEVESIIRVLLLSSVRRRRPCAGGAMAETLVRVRHLSSFSSGARTFTVMD